MDYGKVNDNDLNYTPTFFDDMDGQNIIFSPELLSTMCSPPGVDGMLASSWWCLASLIFLSRAPPYM